MGFYDAKGYWRQEGDAFYDGKGYLRQPGEAFYDARGESLAMHFMIHGASFADRETPIMTGLAKSVCRTITLPQRRCV